ncbi:juvenile hormone esterase-like [Uranotaenia lowii]|uniref:juvenile hormone esterase-like n=1 Tax=Uranotaenia lowii TaxID=190385 RepID=UPI00247B2D2F|nr:juvenile hormone esterase-like [Uranotaenia lowii]
MLILTAIAYLLTGSVLLCQGQDVRPIISSPSGEIQGTTESCGIFCTYYSFKGIPYAVTPVGNMRFRNPVPHPGWSGVRDGSQHRSICVQLETFTLSVTGDEDCLYLNVYSQQLVGSRPVMVYFHGGAFSAGSGHSDVADPKKLVQEDVVVVTVNYRLGVLGFLSTGDQHAQGNWGLKDCVEALRWVQRNIAAFGGNPNDVTIFGNSAGGSLVHFLYLSALADGLFHKTIAISGVALATYAFQTNPKFYADRLAQAFGFSSDSAVYVNQLRTVPAGDFIAFQELLFTIPIPRFLRPLDFAPVLEPVNSPEPRALTATPLQLMNTRPNRGPLMFGFNDMEGSMFTVLELLVDSTVWDRFNAEPHLLVPFFWNIPQGSSAAASVIDSFRQRYFNGQPLGPAVDIEWAQYYGDHIFSFPIDETVRIHAGRALGSPVYFYQLAYDGDLNLVKKSFGITHPGAIHADELPYIFDQTELFNADISPNSHALIVSQRVVRLLANFAKYGNPTPSADPLLQNTIWPNVASGSGNTPIMNIGENLVVSDASAVTRVGLWRDLQTRYASNPFA